MAIQFSDNVKLASNKPLDDRQTFLTKAAVLDTSTGISKTRRYAGLMVYIADEQKWYGFKGGTADENFIPINSGGGIGPIEDNIDMNGYSIYNTHIYNTSARTSPLNIENASENFFGRNLQMLARGQIYIRPDHMMQNEELNVVNFRDNTLLKGVGYPVEDTDVANKKYVDDNTATQIQTYINTPDYAKMENVNRISTNNGSWTVDRDGFVFMVMATTPSAIMYFTINGIEKYFGYAGVSQIIPVKKGDILSMRATNFFDFCQCYYIPPANVPIAIADAVNIPDYRNKETTNRISTNNGSWKADRDGFVYCEFNLQNSSQYYIYVNERSAARGGIGANGGGYYAEVVTIAKDDVIRMQATQGTVNDIQCCYIPPIKIPAPHYDALPLAGGVMSGNIDFSVPTFRIGHEDEDGNFAGIFRNGSTGISLSDQAKDIYIGFNGIRWIQNVAGADFSVQGSKIVDASDPTNAMDVANKRYVDNINGYSSTETSVGTWINGKTIYKKSMSVSGVSSDLIPGNFFDFDTGMTTTNASIIRGELNIYNGGMQRSIGTTEMSFTDSTGSRVKIRNTGSINLINGTWFITMYYIRD